MVWYSIHEAVLYTNLTIIDMPITHGCKDLKCSGIILAKGHRSDNLAVICTKIMEDELDPKRMATREKLGKDASCMTNLNKTGTAGSLTRANL